MNLSKTSKGALVISGVALLICCAMLLGTTWAWFTDEVTSAGNIIQAGTLKIDLEHLDKNGNWISIKEQIENGNADYKVFDYDLWEPGYTQYETLKVTNMDSTLALKFRLNAIVANGTAITGANGELLQNVIDVYVANGAVTKPASFRDILADSDWRRAGTLAELMADPDGVAYGVIVPDDAFMANLTAEEQAFAQIDEATMTLALHMREEAGNEYQGLSVGDISLNLFATQYTYENDSFDHKYDDGLNLEEDGVLTEVDGIQYIQTPEGNNYFYVVTEDFTGDTVNVPESVTDIANYAFYYNSNVKTVNVPGTVENLGRAFDSSSVETVTLGEGITTVSNRLFRKAANLKDLTLPTTLTTIEEAAFQGCGLTELTIPAAVTDIEFAAVAYMPNLETLIIEGSPEIPSYFARACPNLKNVYLLGEDTTFGAGSIFFSTTEGGINDTITVYCANQTVADRLVAASAYDGFTIVVLNP